LGSGSTRRSILPRYYVTGGRQRESTLLTRNEWHAYEKAVLIEIDTDTGGVRTVLAHASPPGRRPAEGASHVFKAGSWDGEHLLLCTQTEVVIFDPAAERIVRTLSHPWFNDVHHVARIDGRLHVVSTGLDAVLELDPTREEAGEAEVIAVHSALDSGPWDRFDPDTDYRLVATTKPHGAHPNFVLEHAGQRWLSRFEQRDVRGLDDRGRAVRLAEDPVHDGVIHQGEAWFTVVSGEVVVVDLVGGAVLRRYDLTTMDHPPGVPLGWCRSILHDGPTLLGFSRLRPTRLKQNLAWLRKPLGKAPEPLPTRVVAYDLPAGRKLRTWSLEEHGISSIFSILPAEPSRGR